MPSLSKSQDQVSMTPVERSVNDTDKGATPLVGDPEKSATGACSYTIIYSVYVFVSDPPGPDTVRLTV